jgi:hypothetical protein
VAELQLTPVAHALAAQETVQVLPLQLTCPAQEFGPEQRTVLPPAIVLMPPAHERRPPQVMSHWFPEQVMAEPQAPSPPHEICVLAASLMVGVPAHKGKSLAGRPT